MTVSPEFRIPPFPFELAPFANWRTHVKEHGVAGLARYELGRVGVSVAVEYARPEYARQPLPWDSEANPSIMVLCHRQGPEVALLLPFFEDSERPVRVLGKPYSLLAQGLASIGGEEMIYPVASHRVARRLPMLEAMKWYVGMRRSRPDRDAIHKNNTHSLKTMARTAKDTMNVIHPTGKVANALERKWMNGVGRVALAVPEADRSKVDVQLLRFDDFPLAKIAWALFRGRRLKNPETITLQIGRRLSLDRLIKDAGNDPAGVTALLRKAYQEDFGRG